ncbi:hypothetical protein BLNAU_20567 [Blattamonas nauphoetae]|uniref:DUF4371 domain-containing protein n=1 Tax=Blattamonas nauphoetae TaxID=2049346 RepID=A0ABQ9WYW0_9EUKA|nr:hypothetical protein BLNAU_20567 [Blattamonas nauphoetae]
MSLRVTVPAFNSESSLFCSASVFMTPVYKIIGQGILCIPCSAARLIRQGNLPENWMEQISEPTIRSIRSTHENERHQNPKSNHRLNLELYTQYMNCRWVIKQPDHQRSFRELAALRFQQVNRISHKSLSDEFMTDLQLLENRLDPDNKLADFGYMSTTIQSEMRQIISNGLHTDLKSLLQTASFYSILLDESTDAGNLSELLVSGHFLIDGAIQPKFLGIVTLGSEGGTGANIASKAKIILDSYDLDKSKCIGLASDGASNLTGEYRGAVTLLNRDYPNAQTVGSLLVPQGRNNSSKTGVLFPPLIFFVKQTARCTNCESQITQMHSYPFSNSVAQSRSVVFLSDLFTL